MKALDTRNTDAIADKHPLLEWYANMHSWGARAKGSSITLSPMIAGRFTIAVDQDGYLELGIHVDDIAPIMSVGWTSAALIRGHQGSDWVALAAADANVIKEDDNPFKLRLFIPLATALGDQFEGFDPKGLRIRAMKVVKKKPVVTIGEPRMELPITKKGFR